MSPADLPVPIDPEFAEMLAMLPEIRITAETLPEFRDLLAALQTTPPVDGVTAEEPCASPTDQLRTSSTTGMTRVVFSWYSAKPGIRVACAE